MKKLSPRLPPVSARWEKLVFRNSIAAPTKINKTHLQKLWMLGYSHKTASVKLDEYNNEAE